MQTILFKTTVMPDQLWLRAAVRECLAYGEHGVEVEHDEHGHQVCFNCQGIL